MKKRISGFFSTLIALSIIALFVPVFIFFKALERVRGSSSEKKQTPRGWNGRQKTSD